MTYIEYGYYESELIRLKMALIHKERDVMKNTTKQLAAKEKTVRLHLELKSDYLSEYQKRMLQRYGEQ